jgi:septal ring factor EnvC (AmiA/AmiB activator)
MEEKFYTSAYQRDKNSKALIATDERALDKHKKQKKMAKQIKDQQTDINRLEEEISEMKKIMETLVEKNK